MANKDKLRSSSKLLQKYDLLQNIWKPPPGFSFPQHHENKRNWRLNSVYLDPSSTAYLPWLTYSKYFDGVFCLPCVTFGENGTKLKKLYSEPFTRWNGVSKRWSKHQSSSTFHKNAVCSMHTFMSQMKGNAEKIDVMMNETKRKIIAKNREKIIPILKTVAFCSRQNLALKGHRDDSKYSEDTTINPGNFQALLNFRIDSGDLILKNHFETTPKNATYKSKTIQNEMINSLGKFIREKIVEEVKEAKLFSLIADEASNCSNKEQLALVLRFVDKTGDVHEEFIQFIHCESTTGEHITLKLKEALGNLNLDLADICGQAYDGAGNMAGSKSGVSTRILQENPKALYFHCASHKLNLAIASCCEIGGVKNMMGSIKRCSDIPFFLRRKIMYLNLSFSLNYLRR